MTADALLGQTVVVIGGSAALGLETARRARAEKPTAAPAVHLRITTALTGATYDIDVGQQIVPG
jgi:NAD(P)-dependent dehydrogenase (short-subunit alcohol dehydrogenase family)